MTITGPKFARVTFGTATVWRSRIGTRRFAWSAATIRRTAGFWRSETPLRDGDSHGFRLRSESCESTAGRSSRRARPPPATPPTVTPAAIRGEAVVVVVLVVGSVPVAGSVPVVAVEVEARSAPIAPGAVATIAVSPPPSRQPARANAVRAGRLTAFEDSGA